MDLTGTRLGSFEVLGLIGRGGMGEVYRARDLELGRIVALKVLPEEVANDPETLARFEREARLLAVLNHAGIAAIHGLERASGRTFLNLELVEGETLQHLLARKRLSVEEALELCVQICEALEAAHAQGIIHRDLKPGNIQVTSSGKIKVLDFGLAKVFRVESRAPEASEAATEEIFQTRQGATRGTAAYMSPEQVREGGVDERSDIWAFGCVLFEVLAGERAFFGATVSDTLGAILHREPRWEALPEIPYKLRDLIARCLRKNPHRRLHHIADARIEIDEVAEYLKFPAARAEVKESRGGLRPPWVIGFAAVAIVLTVAGVAWLGDRTRDGADQRTVQRFNLVVPEGYLLTMDDEKPRPLAISGDGARVAFSATGADGPRIFLRRLDRLEAEPVDGTEGGYGPFFSPDGRWLAFFAEGKLKKVSLPGGAAIELCDAPRGWGGTWGEDDSIIFAPAMGSGLWRVDAAGGEPIRLTVPNLDQGEQQHDSPYLLPGAEVVLFNIWTGGSYADGRIGVLYLDSGQWRSLIVGGSDPFYLPSGHLVWTHEGSLVAARFDARSKEITGRPVQVLDGLLSTRGVGAGLYAVSTSGALVYAPGAALAAESRLVWVARDGSLAEVTSERRSYNLPRLSPDESQIVFQSSEDGFDIWSYDLERGAFSRLTFDETWEGFPIWSPDGGWVTFSSGRAGPFGLFRTRSDGSAPPEALVAGDDSRWPSCWSADGETLIYHQLSPQSGFDLWRFDRDTGSAEVFLRTEFDEAWGRLSPSGRWLAYESDESGERQVYVVGYPARETKRQVSAKGGARPFWGPSGDELFFLVEDRLMVADAVGEERLEFSKPRALFDRDRVWITDVSNDGSRFLGAQDPEPERIGRLVTVRNWITEVEQAVAAESG